MYGDSSKQTLCHPANSGLDWRNTGNGGLFWNRDLTLNPDEAVFSPHVGALRLLMPRRPLNRLSGGARVDRPGSQGKHLCLAQEAHVPH